MNILVLVVFSSLATAALVEASHTPRHRWEALSESQRSQALERAEDHGMFARMDMEEDGDVRGRFVRFHYDAASGALRNFTISRGAQTVLVFDAVTPQPFVAAEEVGAFGNVFRASSPDLTVAVHNNPAALSHWSVPANASQSVVVTFDLASDVSVTSNNGHSARMDRGEGHIHLVSKGNATLTNTTEGLSATIPPGERLLLVAHPPSGHMAAFLHAMNALYERGVLGGVYWMVGVEGTAVFDGVETDAVVEVTSIRRGHLTIQADSNATGPRVFVFVVDPDTLNPQRADRVKARINGAAVQEAASEDEVGLGSEARVRVMRGQEVAVVFVMVPHFSTQTIELEEEGAETGTGGTGSSPTGTSTIGATALFVAVGGAALVWRRRP